MADQGGWKTVHSAAVATATVELNCPINSRITILHTMTGAGAAGYVNLWIRTAVGGTDYAHPAPAGNSDWGLNVKTSDQTAAYISTWLCIGGGIVGIKLNRTDGAHTVKVFIH